jgi:hypothetical protein
MDITIKNKDLEYLKTVELKQISYKKKFNNPNFKYVLSPDDLNKNDKIYIFPNCKIKKLPLRKYLKSKNIKQVFNPKEANILVMKECTLGFSDWSNDTIQFSKRIEIPAGKYYHNNDKNRVYAEYDRPVYFSFGSFKRFIFHTCINNGTYDHYYSPKHNSVYRKYEKIYKTKNLVRIGHSKINKDHIDALIDQSKNFINEVDLQQFVYDWEVNNKVRVDSSDYNWKAIQDLLESKDSWKLAIEMIKKLDVEAILSKLICCYYSRKLTEHTRKEIYQKIFNRNPLLLKCISKWNSYDVYMRYNDSGIIRMLKRCKENNIKINIEDFKLFDILVETFTAANGEEIYHITHIESDN